MVKFGWDFLRKHLSKKITVYRWIFLDALLLFFVLGLVGSPMFQSCEGKGPRSALSARGGSPLADADSQKAAKKLQQAFHEVAKQVNPAVVFISTESVVKVRPMFDFRDFFGRGMPQQRREPQKRVRKGLGSGFIISSDGYIVTNYHVVKGAQKITVKVQNEKEYKAKVVGTDPVLDLALIKVDAEDLEHVYFGDSDNINVGDWAIAIGNPFGLSHTFTVGVISHAGRRNIDPHGIGHYIQTDASINRGNSGGPLLNINGEVIGINRMIFSQSGGSIGIGFAVPVNSAKNVIQQLKEHGKVKRGWLGVQVQERLSPEFRKELGIEKGQGVFVAQVQEGSPADKAGIREQDVILSLDGKEIKNFSDLSSQVKMTKPGKTVPVVVWRNKSRVKLWVTIREYPTERMEKRQRRRRR